MREYDPKHFVTTNINEQDVIDLKEIFDYFDTTKSGVLLPTDLMALLSQNGYQTNKNSAYQIIAEYDHE